MKIINEVEEMMVNIDCEFEDYEIESLRSYFKEKCSAQGKMEVEVNWAMIDILKKRIGQEKFDREYDKEYDNITSKSTNFCAGTAFVSPTSLTDEDGTIKWTPGYDVVIEGVVQTYIGLIINDDKTKILFKHKSSCKRWMLKNLEEITATLYNEGYYISYANL